jgi:hypothetical protein
MGFASQIIGVISIIGMVIAFIPCLGWLNWFVLPVAFIGLILAIIGINDNDINQKGKAKTGLILCIIVLVLGTIRWVSGGFIF